MTMYSLSHFIQAWLLPPGFNLFLLMLGLLAWYYWPTAGKIMVGLGILSLYLLSTPFIAYNLIDLLQATYPMLTPTTLTQMSQPDAIVVLGGGETIEAEYGNKHSVSNFTLHRLDYAAYLHEKTQLPIIVSGGKPHAELASEAELMADYLRDKQHISNVFKEDRSMTTADESELIASLLKQNRFHQVYLVTNAWHMPRSVFIFQCAGIQVTPAPMGYYLYGPGYALISFLPNIEALSASTVAIHEFIGLFWYRLNYGKQCRVS